MYLGGDLANAGATLNLSALGLHAGLLPGHAIQGGTVIADAAMDLAGTTLDAVAWRGVLGAFTGAGGTIALRRGIDFPQGASIDLRGGASLLGEDLAVIPDGAIRLGGGGITGRIVLGADARTTVSGGASLGAGVINQGVIALDPGAVLTVGGAANLGTIAVGGGSVMAGAATRQLGTLDFRAGNGTLAIDGHAAWDLSGTLVGFAPGDAIVLTGNILGPGLYGYGALDGVLTITLTSGTARFALADPDMALTADLVYGSQGLALVVAPTSAEPPEVLPEPLVLPVRNGAGQNVTYSYATEEALQRAAVQLFYSRIDPFVVPSAVYVPGTVPTVPASTGGAVLVVDTPGALAVPDAFETVLIDAPGPVQVIDNHERGNRVFAGAGGTVLLAQPADGMFVASGGDNVFFAGTNPSGRWSVVFGDGNDVAVTGAGTDTVVTGGGRNTVWLGAGGGYVEAQGSADIVVGGAGAATVALRGGNDVVFGGTGPLFIEGGAGSSTILGAAGGTTLFGGDGDDVVFGAGPLAWYGGRGTPTLVGGGGAVTAVGGSGGGVFWGGSGGPNRIDVTGDATIVGGAAGDVLRSHGTGTHVVYGGPGAATISAISSSAPTCCSPAPAPACCRPAAACRCWRPGRGGTLAGGLGAAVFEFINGYGGGAVTVTGFNPAVGRIALVGFAPDAAATALAAGRPSAAGYTMSLPDGTRLLFQDLGLLPASVFL